MSSQWDWEEVVSSDVIGVGFEGFLFQCHIHTMLRLFQSVPFVSQAAVLQCGIEVYVVQSTDYRMI